MRMSHHTTLFVFFVYSCAHPLSRIVTTAMAMSLAAVLEQAWHATGQTDVPVMLLTQPLWMHAAPHLAAPKLNALPPLPSLTSVD